MPWRKSTSAFTYLVLAIFVASVGLISFEFCPGAPGKIIGCSVSSKFIPESVSVQSTESEHCESSGSTCSVSLQLIKIHKIVKI